MKKKMFIVLALLVALPMTAQESHEIPYIPLVEEGKMWIGEYCGENMNLFTRPCIQYLQGDTTINGKTYKKLYQFAPEGNFMEDMTIQNHYVTAMREEDKKVYRVTDDGEELLYNFGLKEGDKEVFTEGGELWYRHVRRVDTLTVNGRQHRMVTYNYGHNNSRDTLRRASQIEGLGNMPDMPSVHYSVHFDWPRVPKIFYSVYFKVGSWNDYHFNIYDDDFYNKYMQIDDLVWREIAYEQEGAETEKISIEPHSNAIQQLFDLQGRRLTEKPAKGVYIQNGKKVVK